MNILNEGMLDKFFQGLFKLLFKGQLKQAEQFIDKTNKVLDRKQKEYLMDRLDKIASDARVLKNKVDI